MKLKQFQIDAFADGVFRGNPAAVVLLDEWLPDSILQAIAMENQLSETAFLIPQEGGYGLRWFTPNTEVDLCGHATLASAHALVAELGLAGDPVRFFTRSGALVVAVVDGGYRMDFPADPPAPDPELHSEVEAALCAPVAELLRGRHDLVAVLGGEDEVASLWPDFRAIAEIEVRGILATAAADDHGLDFVSRCFFPRCAIDEDPVTGSAHTTMAPYWGARFGKAALAARQISSRGGDVGCLVEGDRVLLSGSAVTFLRGEIEIPS